MIEAVKKANGPTSVYLLSKFSTTMDLKTLSSFGGFQPQNLFSCVKWWNRFITAVWSFSNLISKTPPEKKSLHNIPKTNKKYKYSIFKSPYKTTSSLEKTQTPRFCVEQARSKNPSTTEEKKHLHHLFGIQTQELRCTLLVVASDQAATTGDSMHHQIFHSSKKYTVKKTGFHKSSFEQKLHV